MRQLCYTIASKVASSLCSSQSFTVACAHTPEDESPSRLPGAPEAPAVGCTGVSPTPLPKNLREADQSMP